MAYEWISDALDETWSSIDQTLRPREPEAYNLPTPCPGWRVHDVLEPSSSDSSLMLQGKTRCHLTTVPGPRT